MVLDNILFWEIKIFKIKMLQNSAITKVFKLTKYGDISRDSSYVWVV